MKNIFPAWAKRAIAFMLAFVLLIALCPISPLTASAAKYTDGSWYYGSYSWINIAFNTNASKVDGVFVFEDDAPYDWTITAAPTRTPPETVTVKATIKDAAGNIVGGSPVTLPSVALEKCSGVATCTMFSAAEYVALTEDMYGTFTLTCELQLNGTTYASMTQTFKRVSSKPVTVSVSSRSNPDNAFTVADPIDLVLNIKKNDGIATAYNAAVTVTKNDGSELLAARGVSLPASTNTVLSVKDLVDLPTITTTGAYNVNLTLTDSTGAVVSQTSTPFYIVGLTGNVTATVTSESNPSLVFNNTTPDVVVNLNKTDGIPEALRTAVTVVDGSGITVYSNTYETTTATAALAPDLSGLAATGTFTLTAVVTDDAGNARANATATITRTNIVPASCTITDYSPDVSGDIYSAGSDFYLSVRVTHKASAGKVLSVKAIGTLNGQPFEATRKITLSSLSGSATAKIDGALLGSYGIFEDLYIAVFDASGTQLWTSPSTYNFSRVLSTATPGDVSLLNINDHFITNTGNASTKLNLAAKAGAAMWRSTIPWSSVEKTEGVYEMPKSVDPILDVTQSLGMKALIILAYENDLYGDPDPSNTTWLNAYTAYCGEVAKYLNDNYPGLVTHFEIWNEWNHATMSKVDNPDNRTGDKYAKVVIAASAAIKKVNSNFKVIGGASAGDGYESGSNSDTFMDTMLATSGFMNAIDGFSFHTYPNPETTNSWNNPRKFVFVSPDEFDYNARIQSVKDRLKGNNKEIWITETGWATNAEPESGIGSDGKTHIITGVTEAEQAAYIVQLYTWALATGAADRIFLYEFMNNCDDQTLTWSESAHGNNWGLIHNWNTSDGQPLAYSAKLGYASVCAFSSKLSGASYKATLSLGSGVSAYQFTKSDGSYITVIWTDGSVKNVTATGSGTITVSDMYGNATAYNGGTAALTLSEAPIYIESASSTLSVS